MEKMIFTLHDWLKGTAFILVLGFIATAIANEKAVRTPVEANSSAAEPDDRGRYLVKITGCNDCHTPGYAQTGGKIPEKDWLTGSSLGFRGPWVPLMPPTSGCICNTSPRTNGSRSRTAPSIVRECPGLFFTT